MGLLWDLKVHLRMLLSLGGTEWCPEAHISQHLKVSKCLCSSPPLHQIQTYIPSSMRGSEKWGWRGVEGIPRFLWSVWRCYFCCLTWNIWRSLWNGVLGNVSSVPYWYLDYIERVDLKFDISVLYLVKVVCVQIYKKVLLIPSVVFLCWIWNL